MYALMKGIWYCFFYATNFDQNAAIATQITKISLVTLFKAWLFVSIKQGRLLEILKILLNLCEECLMKNISLGMYRLFSYVG